MGIMAAKIHRIVVTYIYIYIDIDNDSNSDNYLCNCYNIIKLWVGLGQGDSTVQFYQQLHIMFMLCDSLFIYYFLNSPPCRNDISCHAQ